MEHECKRCLSTFHCCRAPRTVPWNEFSPFGELWIEQAEAAEVARHTTNSAMARQNTLHSIKVVTLMLEQRLLCQGRSSNRCSDDVVRCIGDRMVFNSNDNTGSLGCWRGIEYRQPKCRPDACNGQLSQPSMPTAWMGTSIHPAQHA